ncbi:11168_t:CDS:2, partial [Dentiscutata erythropus]
AEMSHTITCSEGRNYRDMYIKHAFKEFDQKFYYECCDSNKTPEPGRMYFSLLQYLYPSNPRKDKYFNETYEKAKRFIFDKFDKVKPYSIGWDSYRSTWAHEDIIREFMIMSNPDCKEFNYVVENTIRSKALFPDGSVYQKSCGIISGTMGTLLINSLLNTIGCLTVLNMMKEIDLDFPT